MLRRAALGTLQTTAQVADLTASLAGDTARTARFLRGWLEFESRPSDIFVSSYPRSGTTWLLYIVHVLLHGGDSGFRHITDVAPWFERNLSLGRCRASDFARTTGPRLFKSHLPLRWLPGGARYIYVERDGRDVAVSYYHFYRSHLQYEGDFESFFDRFLRGKLQYGSWFKHRAGFRTLAERADLLVLQYESLLADLVCEMARIATFCGLRYSTTRLNTLAELCRFARMKEQQERFDHATGEDLQGRVAPGQFLRSGEKGGHHALLGPGQRAAFDARSATRLLRPDIELHLPAFLH